MRPHAAAFALLATLATSAAAFAAQPSPSPAPARPNSSTLVREALDAPRHVSYVGQLQTIRWGTRMANATIQRVEHLAPASTRRTFLAPEALYGEYDITLGFSGARELVANLKQFVPQLRRMVMLPDCGHWTQQERPDDVNAAMIEFLHGL